MIALGPRGATQLSLDPGSASTPAVELASQTGLFSNNGVVTVVMNGVQAWNSGNVDPLSLITGTLTAAGGVYRDNVLAGAVAAWPSANACAQSVLFARSSLGAASRNPGWDGVLVPTGTFPTGTQAAPAFWGATLMHDGRIFITPSSATTARIYDPATQGVTTPGGAFPGSVGHAEAVLMRDGRLYCIPYNATTARIYDVVTNAVTTPTGTFPGSAGFAGGCLLPDGRVLCCPRSATALRIYNAVTDSVSTPAASLGVTTGSNFFSGCVLLPDGRVVLVPYTAPQLVVYDPVADTASSGPAGANNFGCGVLLADGRVYLVPNSERTTALIYDPSTNGVSTPSGTFGDSYRSAARLPDGRVFCLPYGNLGITAARIYDPTTDTLSTPKGSYPIYTGTAACMGCVIQEDGMVFCGPHMGSTARLATCGGWGAVRLPRAVLTSKM